MTKELEIIEVMENFSIIVPKDKSKWTCNNHVPLIVTVESISSQDICDDEDEADFWIYDVGIMPHRDVMHKDFVKHIFESNGIGEENIGDEIYYEIQHYRGAIPVNINSIEIPNEKLTFEYKPDGNAIRVYNNAMNPIPDEQIITEFIIPRLDAIFGLIGFVLDAQSRRIGTTGWDELNHFLKNIDPINKIMNKISQKGSKKKKLIDSLK